MGGLRDMFAVKKPLDELANKGDVAKVRKAVEKGANVNELSPDPKLFRRSALHAATVRGHTDMVEALVNLGADVDIKDSLGRTPLHYAVQCLHAPLVTLLLECGADYTLRDHSGNMPIHLAISSGNVQAKEVLLGRALEHSMEFAFFEQGHWLPYDEGAARLLGFELGDGVGFAALALGENANYVVDFEQQVQINVLSLFMKSVSWRVLPNGRWNRPRAPFQGLHPGSQDPRHLGKYDSLLRQLSGQGVQVCPLYFRLHGALPAGAEARNWEPAPAASAPASSLLAAPFQASEQDDMSRLPPVQLNPDGPAVAWATSGDGDSEPGTPLQRSRAEGMALGEGLSFSLSESVRQEGRSTSLSRTLASAGDYEAFAGGQVERVTLQPLRSGSEEYNEIAARFLRGMAREVQGTAGQQGVGSQDMRPVTVSIVSRIKLPWERVEPFVKARAGLKARWGSDNVHRGWHGGPKAGLERILQQGFTLAPHGRNGRVYGDGVYLAPEDCARTSAEFASPDASGTKYVLLCLAALGSMEQVPFDSCMRRPSNVMRFDTGVDNLESPTRYIIWEEDMNDLILPTHMLAFRYC